MSKVSVNRVVSLPDPTGVGRQVIAECRAHYPAEASRDLIAQAVMESARQVLAELGVEHDWLILSPLRSGGDDD